MTERIKTISIDQILWKCFESLLTVARQQDGKVENANLFIWLSALLISSIAGFVTLSGCCWWVKVVEISRFHKASFQAPGMLSRPSAGLGSRKKPVQTPSFCCTLGWVIYSNSEAKGWAPSAQKLVCSFGLLSGRNLNTLYSPLCQPGCGGLRPGSESARLLLVFPSIAS